jgi:hypothetical protein
MLNLMIHELAMELLRAKQLLCDKVAARRDLFTIDA